MTRAKDFARESLQSCRGGRIVRDMGRSPPCAVANTAQGIQTREPRAILFRKPFLEGIRAGTITVAFRQWDRPSVRAGGTLLTKAGQLEIVSVAPIDPARITARDARRAGFESRDALLAEVLRRGSGTVYRIELGALRPDPRVDLRASVPASPEDIAAIVARLDRLDAASRTGPWTRAVLGLIAKHPARRAGDICEMFGQEKLPFKVNVRKLKRLGLTESLDVGYRLSPRGAAVYESFARGSKKRKKA